MENRNHELTEAEWAIIQVVWENEPCAVPTIQEELQARKNWHYSTVRAVKRAFDGALTPMMQFMLDEHNLSQKQLAELESLIKKKRSRSGGRKKR